jgi:hypothetical protein
LLSWLKKESWTAAVIRTLGITGQHLEECKTYAWVGIIAKDLLLGLTAIDTRIYS